MDQLKSPQRTLCLSFSSLSKLTLIVSVLGKHWVKLPVHRDLGDVCNDCPLPPCFPVWSVSLSVGQLERFAGAERGRLERHGHEGPGPGAGSQHGELECCPQSRQPQERRGPRLGPGDRRYGRWLPRCSHSGSAIRLLFPITDLGNRVPML